MAEDLEMGAAEEGKDILETLVPGLGKKKKTDEDDEMAPLTKKGKPKGQEEPLNPDENPALKQQKKDLKEKSEGDDQEEDEEKETKPSDQEKEKPDKEPETKSKDEKSPVENVTDGLSAIKNSSTAKGARIGTEIGGKVGGVGAVPGAVIGAAVGAAIDIAKSANNLGATNAERADTAFEGQVTKGTGPDQGTATAIGGAEKMLDLADMVGNPEGGMASVGDKGIKAIESTSKMAAPMAKLGKIKQIGMHIKTSLDEAKPTGDEPEPEALQPSM